MKASQTKSKESDLILPFRDVDRGALPVVGGKAANLGELTRTGLPVPPGFCVTTAAYELVADGDDLRRILDDRGEMPTEDTVGLGELAAEARGTLVAAFVLANVIEAI